MPDNVSSLALEQQLSVAVYEHRYEEAERLLGEGADINAKNFHGETLLARLAGSENRLEELAWVLDHGGHPDARDRRKDTPLIMAVRQNHPEKVALLLKGGANPNLVNEHGNTPLLEATLLPEDKDYGLVRLFLEAAGLIHRDEPDPFTSWMVAKSKSLSGKEKQALMENFQKEQGKRTSSQLRHEVHMDPVPGLALDINATSSSMTTALMAAVGRKQFRAAAALIKAGADTAATDHLGRSLVHGAVLSQEPGMIEMLLSMVPDIDVDIPAHSGTTPLGEAAAFCMPPFVIGWLLEAGADPNTSSKNRIFGDIRPLESVLLQLEPDVFSRKAVNEEMERLKEVTPPGTNVSMEMARESLREGTREANKDILEVARLILDKGGQADLRHKDTGWFGAPAAAVKMASVEALEALAPYLPEGAMARPLTCYESTPLDVLAHWGMHPAKMDVDDPQLEKLMERMIQLGAPVSRPHWDTAVDGPFPELSGEEKKSFVRAPSLPVLFHKSGWTRGWELLVKHGGDLNDVCPDEGLTLAHIMANEGFGASTAARQAMAVSGSRLAKQGKKEDFLLQKQAWEAQHIKAREELFEKATRLGLRWDTPCTEDGTTPLHIAVARGDDAMVDFLIKQDGVKVSAQNKDGMTPLSMALARGRIDLFVKLAQHGVAGGEADCAADALVRAIECAPTQTGMTVPLSRAIRLLAAQARIPEKGVDAQSILDRFRRYDKDKEAYAQRARSLDEAKKSWVKERSAMVKLAREEAKKEAQTRGLDDEDTRELLAEAKQKAEKRFEEKARQDIQAGTDMPGLAIACDSDKVVEYDPSWDATPPETPKPVSADEIGLLPTSRDSLWKTMCEARNEEGVPVQAMAAGLGHRSVLRALLEAGVDPDATDDAGNTALMQAAFAEDGECVHLLRAAGADMQKKNKQGQTVFDVVDYVGTDYLCGVMQDNIDELEKVIQGERTSPSGEVVHDALLVHLLLQGKKELVEKLPVSEALEQERDRFEKTAQAKEAFWEKHVKGAIPTSRSKRAPGM